MGESAIRHLFPKHENGLGSKFHSQHASSVGPFLAHTKGKDVKSIHGFSCVVSGFLRFPPPPRPTIDTPPFDKDLVKPPTTSFFDKPLCDRDTDPEKDSLPSATYPTSLPPPATAAPHRHFDFLQNVEMFLGRLVVDYLFGPSRPLLKLHHTPPATSEPPLAQHLP
jgi:hypothetical protein